MSYIQRTELFLTCKLSVKAWEFELKSASYLLFSEQVVLFHLAYPYATAQYALMSRRQRRLLQFLLMTYDDRIESQNFLFISNRCFGLYSVHFASRLWGSGHWLASVRRLIGSPLCISFSNKMKTLLRKTCIHDSHSLTLKHGSK